MTLQLEKVHYFKGYNGDRLGEIRAGETVVVMELDEETNTALVVTLEGRIERLQEGEVTSLDEAAAPQPIKEIGQARKIWADQAENFKANEALGGSDNVKENEEFIQSMLTVKNADGNEVALRILVMPQLEELFAKRQSEGYSAAWVQTAKGLLKDEAVSKFLIGGALLQALANHEHLRTGARGGKKGFMEWAEREFGLKSAILYRRMQLYTYYTNLLPADRILQVVEALGPSKMYQISKHADANNIDELIAIASQKSVNELNDYLAVIYGKGDVHEEEDLNWSGEVQTTKLEKVTVKLYPDQVELFERVKLRLAQDGTFDPTADNANAQALVRLMSDFLSNTNDSVLHTGSNEELASYLNARDPHTKWTYSVQTEAENYATLMQEAGALI